MTNIINYINYISDDKMTYSYSAIENCKKAIKEFTWSAPKRKNEFFAVAMELKKLYNFLYESTKCILLQPDDFNYDFIQFFRAAYDYKNYTAKELSKMLKQNELYIKHEIIGIYRMMEAGEVNTII